MNPPDLQFVAEGRLLSFRGPLPNGCIPIENMNEAERLAWDQSEEFPCWNDLRSQVAAETGAWKSDQTLTVAVTELVEAFLPWQFEKLQDDVAADLIRCAAYASTEERSQVPFYSTMLAAYAAGGWPCGWSGTYPNGELFVFWPPIDSIPKVPTSIHERRLALKKQRLQDRFKANGLAAEADGSGA